MTDQITSLIRTNVPIAVGASVGWLADAGVAVSEDTSTAAVVAISGAASAIWYAAARWLEQKSAAWGWLLGVPKPPTY